MWLSKKDFWLKWNRNLHLHNLDCFPNKYSNEEEIMQMMPARAPLRGWGSSWSRRSVTLAFSRTVKSDTRVAHSQYFSHAHARLFYLDFWLLTIPSFLFSSTSIFINEWQRRNATLIPLNPRHHIVCNLMWEERNGRRRRQRTIAADCCVLAKMNIQNRKLLFFWATHSVYFESTLLFTNYRHLF